MPVHGVGRQLQWRSSSPGGRRRAGLIIGTQGKQLETRNILQVEKFAIAVLGTNFHPLLAFDCLISVLMVRTVDSRWGVTPHVGHTAGPDKTEELPAA